MNLTINDVVYRGRGRARSEGFVVFVPGVLPGEEGEVEITDRRKNFAFARLVAILRPSAARIEPVCPLAFRPTTDPAAWTARCPGCAYQHVAYAEEIRLKQAQLTVMLKHSLPDCREVPALPVPAPAELAYRNKIVLHAAQNDTQWTLGYFAEDNATVIDVAACPLARRPINEKLASLRSDPDFVRSLGDRGSVTLRHTETAWYDCARRTSKMSALAGSSRLGGSAM